MEINEDSFNGEQSIDSFYNFNDNNELIIHLFSKLCESFNKEKVNIPYNNIILSQLKKKLFSNK